MAGGELPAWFHTCQRQDKAVQARLVFALGFALLASGTEALGTPVSLRCANFRHNPDGSWSPRRPVTIAGVTIGRRVSFGEAVSVSGVDLAATLDRRCRRGRS